MDFFLFHIIFHITYGLQNVTFIDNITKSLLCLTVVDVTMLNRNCLQCRRIRKGSHIRQDSWSRDVERHGHCWDILTWSAKISWHCIHVCDTTKQKRYQLSNSHFQIRYRLVSVQQAFETFPLFWLTPEVLSTHYWTRRSTFVLPKPVDVPDLEPGELDPFQHHNYNRV
jgi:hypothetical protein